jgi:hypothetical protein
MERVRLMCWCRSCVSGLHLPAYAAADSGLFAEQALEVEFVDMVTPSDGSLGAWSAMVGAVAEGDVDFALTSVANLLAGQTAADGGLAARFAAVFHQRNPIAALVAGDSTLHEVEDLESPKLAASASWLVQEFEGALTHLGLAPPTVVGPPRDGYATGLAAADRLALELVSRMRDGLAAGYELQREHPELGIEAFRRRCPGISETHLRTGWSVFEPYASGRPEPLSMDAERWQTTIDYTSAAHGLPSLPAEQVYRPELLAPAPDCAPA